MKSADPDSGPAASPWDEVTRRPEVVRRRHGGRKWARPANVVTHAAQANGYAGVVYVSSSLGCRCEKIKCDLPITATYLALLMAMRDAERAMLGPIVFWVDNRDPVFVSAGGPVEAKREIAEFLEDHAEWDIRIRRETCGTARLLSLQKLVE